MNLALSIIERMLSKKLYQEPFLKEYTDLPFLVRTDTKELVRLAEVDTSDAGFDARSVELFAKSDKHEGKPHECFVAFNLKNKKLTLMPGTEGSTVESLRLSDMDWDINPALTGTYTVKLKDGKRVKVTPAFELFKREVAQVQGREGPTPDRRAPGHRG